MDNKLIKRTLLGEAKKHLKKKEISFIVGPRQVGKTTLMKELQEELEKRGEKTVFLSLDFEEDAKFFVSQNHFIKKLELELGKGHGYVFIDEIQRKKDAGIFLKGIYDLGLPYKFIVSGSGSVELKEKVHESLTGRKRFFPMNPISFNEFVNFRTEYKYENRLADYYSLEKERTVAFTAEYLNFGGYPRVVLEEELPEKIKIIAEIYQSYLEKDISHLLKVEKLDAFTSLVKILASQIGSLINYSEIASTLAVSQATVKNYLWYLEKTFVIRKLTPYFRNVRKEITKSPIFYFYDLGLRNYALNLFGNLNRLDEAGFVFENFVFNHLKEKECLANGSFHFWRTQEKAEVDFIVNLGQKIIPIEAKYKDFKKPVIEKSLRSFINKYQPERALIVTKDFKSQLKIAKTKVDFIPFWEMLIDDKFKALIG